jgi:hypothetical protein
MFNPVSNSWVHGFICVGQENPVWANQIEINDGVYNYSNYPYAIGASLSNQGGMGWHYMLKDGTYGKTSKLGGYNGGACLHNTDSRFEKSCSHNKYVNASPYLSREQSFSLPVDKFDYDEENMTYSAQNEIYTLSNGSYVPTGRYINVNNYLSFYLGGGNVSTYAKHDIPLFGNATYDLSKENQATLKPIEYSLNGELKSAGLNETGWAYSNGVMTFSTYIKNFAINNDDRKAQVKGYLLVEDAYGDRFYILLPVLTERFTARKIPITDAV